MTGSPESICRVCGYDDGDERWTSCGSPNYVICPCCAAESGVDDLTVKIVRKYRAGWTANGRPWFEDAMRPDHWDAEDQLNRLPTEWQ